MNSQLLYMNKKFYITTAIPYANSPLHVGHVLEYVEADVIARYHKFLGEDVYHLAGADENAQKNVLAAEKAGVPIQEFIDQNVDLQKKALKLLNISNDQYIKTSDKKIHFPGVQKLWQAEHLLPEHEANLVEVLKGNLAAIESLKVNLFHVPKNFPPGFRYLK